MLLAVANSPCRRKIRQSGRRRGRSSRAPGRRRLTMLIRLPAPSGSSPIDRSTETSGLPGKVVRHSKNLGTSTRVRTCSPLVRVAHPQILFPRCVRVARDGHHRAVGLHLGRLVAQIVPLHPPLGIADQCPDAVWRHREIAD